MSAAWRNRRRPEDNAPPGAPEGTPGPSSSTGSPPKAGPALRPRRAPQHRRAADGRPSVAQILQWTTAGTALFTVVALAAAVAPDQLGTVAVAVSMVLFAVGCAAFLTGFSRAVSRSRVDEMDLPGLFFLSGSVEPAVRRRLFILLAMQVAVGIAAASTRPFTAVAFCTLTPIFALGMMALCGATHGHFAARRS